MSMSIYTLIRIGEDVSTDREKQLDNLYSRVSSLFDWSSHTPCIDGYLYPESVDFDGIEDDEIVLGTENPEKIIDWAKTMAEKNREEAKKVIRENRALLEDAVLDSVCDDNAHIIEYIQLSKALELLTGQVNDETNWIMIDECDSICTSPAERDLEDIMQHPEFWALCWINFCEF